MASRPVALPFTRGPIPSSSRGLLDGWALWSAYLSLAKKESLTLSRTHVYPLDHEGRIARLEGIVEQIDVRLGRIETKLDANDAKIDATREALDSKIDRLYRWVIPLQITTILAIAGLAFKTFSG